MNFVNARTMLAAVLIVLAATTQFRGAAGSLFSGTATWQTEETDLKEPAKDLKSVSITTDNGSIAVAGTSDASEVSVHVTKKAGGTDDADAAECLKAVKIESNVKGTTLSLGWSWAQPRKKSWQASVAFEVRLPARLTVSAMSHNGAIELSKMASAAILNTHNGAIKVNGIEGSLKVATDNGAIEVKGLRGDFDGQTHNGRVDVVAVLSNIRARTDNGAVKADLSGSKAISGQIATSNGSITVQLGDQASAQVACKTALGAIKAERLVVHAEQPIAPAVREKGALKGTVGSGEGNLEIETKTGSITVR